MKRMIALGLAMAVAACGEGPSGEPVGSSPAADNSATTSPPSFDLAACEARQPDDDGYFYGNAPVAAPPEAGAVMVSGTKAFMVSTQTGETMCHSLAWISVFESADWLLSDRLLGMEYSGYESFGYLLVDRAGSGRIVDTGARPVFSPDGRLLAALQLSEAGWGGMEGFALWQVEPDGLRELTRQVADETNDWVPPAPFAIPAHDWRIEGWRGKDCLDISAQRWLTEPPYGDAEGRSSFFASATNGWRVSEGTCR